MSSNASDISGTKFGYDFVVATTQASINATMLNFFSTRKEPTVVVCFVADSKGNPVIIDYDLLKWHRSILCSSFSWRGCYL